MKSATEDMRSCERIFGKGEAMLECNLEGCTNTFKEYGEKRFCCEAHNQKQKRIDQRVYDTRPCRVCGTKFTTHKPMKALCDDPTCAEQNKKDWDKKHNDKKKTNKIKKKTENPSTHILEKRSVKKEEWDYRDCDETETQLLKDFFDNGGTVTFIEPIK